jgi:hypothetical protein
MQSIRTWHTYIGILIAPSVLFFAITGTLQLFSLHEAHDGYSPPALIEKLGSLHKDQVFALKEHDHDQPPPGAADAQSQDHHAEAKDDDEGAPVAVYALKWCFALVAVGLITSTLLGLWMGLTHLRHKRIGWWLLLLGCALPLGLIIL